MNGKARRNKLGEIASIASALRTDAADQGGMPDLTSSILSRVDAQRPFLNRSTRRAIWASRLSLGGSVAIVVLAACVAWRLWPEKMDLTNRPAPLSAVVDTVGSRATTQLVNLRQSFGNVGQTDAREIISAVALRIEPLECRHATMGPTMPALEAVSRGVCSQPMSLTRAATLAPASKYKQAMPARSTIAPLADASQGSFSVRAASYSTESLARPGVLFDEQELDVGFGPK